MLAVLHQAYFEVGLYSVVVVVAGVAVGAHLRWKPGVVPVAVGMVSQHIPVKLTVCLAVGVEERIDVAVELGVEDMLLLLNRLEEVEDSAAVDVLVVEANIEAGVLGEERIEAVGQEEVHSCFHLEVLHCQVSLQFKR